MIYSIAMIWNYMNHDKKVWPYRPPPVGTCPKGPQCKWHLRLSLFFISFLHLLLIFPISTSSSVPRLLHSFSTCVHTSLCVFLCMFMWRMCMHTEAYHNKQSKYPVGIHTFSLPPSPSGTSETQLIPQHTFKSLNQLKRPGWHQPWLSDTHTHTQTNTNTTMHTQR